MRKLFLLLALLSAYAISYPQTLVAYYPFNGNANDESGNGRHGTLMNGVTLTTDRFNIANSAYDFDGVDDYIDISATGLPTTDRTVAFWLRPATGNQSSYPVCYGGISCGYSFVMGFNPSGCGCYSTQGHCGTNGLTYNWVTNPENTWVHYTVTINGSSIKIYINGLSAANNSAFSYATYVDGKKMIIGGLITPDGLSTYIDPSGGYFKGKLDEVRIYETALNDAQVWSVYAGFALPVTLLNFQAEKLNARTAKLTWRTATEINNKGFEVQRSFDGNYFTAMQFVNGAGNSNDIREYSITDVPGTTGQVFYRLRQIDFDDKSHLSNIVSLLFDKQGIIKVYPNPAQQQVVVEGIEHYNRIQLIDAGGKLVKERLNNGLHQVRLNLTGVKSSMYFLRLINNKETQTVKLMIKN